MSRKIDRERILAGDLTEEEVRYLQDRNELPANYSLNGTSDEDVKQFEVPEEEKTTDNYPDWSNGELREELEERELATHGNKSELVARLRADDREEQE